MRSATFPLFKPGDVVRTPSGRTAEVVEARADGKRDLKYTDEEGGSVALEPDMLTMLKPATVRPWPSRKPT